MTILEKIKEDFPKLKTGPDGIPEGICAASLGYERECEGKQKRECKKCWQQIYIESKQNDTCQKLQQIPYNKQTAEEECTSGVANDRGKQNFLRSQYYTRNDYFNMVSTDTLHILPKFETYQQTTEYTCGAACALMTLNHFGQKKYHEKMLANLMETRPNIGTSVESMADLFDLIGWNAYCHTDTEQIFADEKEFESAVIRLIDSGIPILVDWADWEGHWAIIIGIDTCGTDTLYDDVLILADPYDRTSHFQDGYGVFSLARFFSLWREGECVHKVKPYVQPFVIAFPKDYAFSPDELLKKYRYIPYAVSLSKQETS